MPAVVEVLSSDDDQPVGTVPAMTAEEKALIECTELKASGNALFGAGRIDEALATYLQALEVAPKKPEEPALPPTSGATTISTGNLDEPSSTTPPATEEAALVSSADYTVTAQLFCNAGFCHMKQHHCKEALPLLSEAIRHDGSYQKAFLRRADCQFELETFSAAFADYEQYEKLGGRLDAAGNARKAQSKAKMDAEVQKMLGDLKELGNKFLGNFGLSTDNFKFDKDAATGSYSMRYEP